MNTKTIRLTEVLVNTKLITFKLNLTGFFYDWTPLRFVNSLEYTTVLLTVFLPSIVSSWDILLVQLLCIIILKSSLSRVLILLFLLNHLYKLNAYEKYYKVPKFEYDLSVVVCKFLGIYILPRFLSPRIIYK